MESLTFLFFSFLNSNIALFLVLRNFISLFPRGIFFIYTRFENTHPAIIDPDTWEIAQKNREQRKRPMKQDEIGLFSGLVICSDCGKRLYHSRGISTAHERENYTCGTYRRFSNRCTAHYIRVVVLEELVLQNLQRVVAYAREDEDEFVRRVIENKLAVQRTEQEQSKREAKAAYYGIGRNYTETL